MSRIGRVCVPFVQNLGQYDERVGFHAQTFGGAVFVTDSGDLVYSLRGPEHDGRSHRVALKEELLEAQTHEPRAMEPGPAKVNFFRGNDPTRWRTGVPTCQSLDLGEPYPGIRVELRAFGNNVEKLFLVCPGANPQNIRIRLHGAAALLETPTGELKVQTALGAVTFTRPIAYQRHNGRSTPVDVRYTIDGIDYGFQVGQYDPAATLIIDPLLASTFLGGEERDGIFEVPIVCDEDGNIYVASRTASEYFPTTPGAYREEGFTGDDVFVSKLDAGLTTLLASTYLGGSGHEGGWTGVGLKLDPDGNVVVSGKTNSSDFPTSPDAYRVTPYGGYDLFITKLTADLSGLVASTYFGGNQNEYGHALALDSAGNIYIAGQTASADTFPITPGAYDDQHGGGGYWNHDVFVSKFDPGLTTLLASTFLGGSGDDFNEELAVTPDGNAVYVGGWTASPNFPTPNGFDQLYAWGQYDAYVSKFDSDLTTLYASTYLGGSSWDFVYAMTLDDNGNVYVGGHTRSSGFPSTPGAYDETYNGFGSEGDDAFVSKLDGSLATLMASTFLGQSSWEISTAMAWRADGTLYVTGYTRSSNFPTTCGAYDRGHHGLHDAYIVRFTDDLSDLTSATLLGASGHIYGTALLLRDDGSVYVAGPTNSPGFPVTDGAFQTTYGGGGTYWAGSTIGGDVFLSLLDGDLSAIPGDLDGSGHVDLDDVQVFASCMSGPGIGLLGACRNADLDCDDDSDLADFAVLQLTYGGP